MSYDLQERNLAARRLVVLEQLLRAHITATERQEEAQRGEGQIVEG